MTTVTPASTAPSPLNSKLLQFESIDTNTNPLDYTFVFDETQYSNKSLLSICEFCGDPSRSSREYTVYKNPAITSLNDHIRASVPVEKQKSRVFMTNLATNLSTNLPIILQHYLANMECSEIFANGDLLPVKYPFTPTEIQTILTKTNVAEFSQTELKKIHGIVIKYHCLTNIQFAGKSLDEWINDAVDCQRFIGTNMKSIIEEIDPGYYPLQGDRQDIDKVDHVINCKKLSYQSTKYGLINIPGGLNMPFRASLFQGTYLNIRMLGWGAGQNADDFSTSFDVPGSLFNSLRLLIGFLYWDKSTFLSAIGHEIGHKISAVQMVGGRPVQTLLLSNADEIATFFQKSKFIDAYKEATKTAVAGVYKDSKGNPQSEQEIEGYFNEQIADFVGILLVERYVRGLATLEEKFKAINYAQLWACGFRKKNEVVNVHPPVSLTRNLIFLNKYLHDTYNQFIGSSGTTPNPAETRCKHVIGNNNSGNPIKFGGGRSKRTKRNRKNRKQRKATHRRRR